jgi:two-component system invasion response regulator UvrY
MIRILIADDHGIVRKGLIQILVKAYPSAQIGEVSSAEELIQEVIRSEWDVVISDLDMPGRGGMDSLQQIKQLKPKLPVLILSFHSEDHYATRVLKAGASGYLKKDLAPDELVTAINKVTIGKRYISPVVAEKLAGEYDLAGIRPPHEHLSDREFEVFRLLAAGKSITEIAEIIRLSPSTVSTYRSRILVKMNMKSNADLTVYMLENKLS